MKLLNQILYWGNFILRKIGAAILAVMFLAITAGIISRYLFNSALSWTEELVCFLMVYLCYISAAITTAEKRHIVADFCIEKAPPKFRKAVALFSRILMIVFFVVLCVSIVKLIPSLRWVSGVLFIPRRFYYYPVFTMSVFMIYAVIVDILNDFFPGYDLIKQAQEKAAAKEKEAEQEEAIEIQKHMDDFMAESAAELAEEAAHKQHRRK